MSEPRLPTALPDGKPKDDDVGNEPWSNSHSDSALRGHVDYVDLAERVVQGVRIDKFYPLEKTRGRKP